MGGALQLVDHSVDCLPDLSPVIIDSVSCSIRELNLRDACLLVCSLDCAIWKNALFLASLREYALQRAIWESDLLGTIGEVLFKLTVVEPEDLEPIGECCLGCALLTKVVDNSLAWEGLLDIPISEMNQGVTVRPNLAANSIWEDDLSAVVSIKPLDLSVFSDHFFGKLIARLML
jgi:hypothetical protein